VTIVRKAEIHRGSLWNGNCDGVSSGGRSTYLEACVNVLVVLFEGLDLFGGKGLALVNRVKQRDAGTTGQS
jgi:hypothetical protein